MYWYDSAGKKHTNDEYTIADISENMIEVFGEPKDEVKIILKAGEIECVWRFLLSAEDIEVRLAVCGDNVEVGRICPLCSEELKVDSFNAQDQKSENDIRVLAVPFDNDKWDRFKSLPYSKSETSYGVTAVYDEESRKGLVIGAIEVRSVESGDKIIFKRRRLRGTFGSNSWSRRREYPRLWGKPWSRQRKLRLLAVYKYYSQS